MVRGGEVRTRTLRQRLRTTTMIRHIFWATFGILLVTGAAARGDVVTDWNATLRNVMQTDGILNAPALANPGWSTRTPAMMNGAIYDAFQSVNRTHTPLMYNSLT